MTLEQKGREIALAFINLDDIVLARELSGSGLSLLAQAGRSVVGTAVVGGGLATRAAVFGAQLATKSAMAATAAARGIVPGADTAEQMAWELDQRIGGTGQTASAIASRGVQIGKADPGPPTDPILGEVWLGKRLEPGSTWNTVLADSAFDLTRLAAFPITVGVRTVEYAMGSPLGQQVTRSFWESLTSMTDMARRASGDTELADRSEKRAMLIALAAVPMWLAMQDAAGLSEGVSRAALGDGRKLRSALHAVLERLEAAAEVHASDGESAVVKNIRARARNAVEHRPARLLAALDACDSGDPMQAMSIAVATVEDSASLAKLSTLYSDLLSDLSLKSTQAAMSGALDADTTETWVRSDEASRAATGRGTRESCPPAVEQLEAIVAAFAPRADAGGARVYSASLIDLARDTVFSYSTRALGRERALARMARLFGTDAADRLRDDCSLAPELVDAGSDRDRRIAELVDALMREGRDRLFQARARAADRLASLTASTEDSLIRGFVPQRTAERVVILQRFLGMADVANALDAAPDEPPARPQAARAGRRLARVGQLIGTVSLLPPLVPGIRHGFSSVASARA